jgi:hypothetical protein
VIWLPRRCLATAAAQITENAVLLLLRVLPSNDRCLQSHGLATDLCAILFSSRVSMLGLRPVTQQRLVKADIEDFILCAVVTVILRVCKLVRLIIVCS